MSTAGNPRESATCTCAATCIMPNLSGENLPGIAGHCRVNGAADQISDQAHPLVPWRLQEDLQYLREGLSSPLPQELWGQAPQGMRYNCEGVGGNPP